MLTVVKSWFVDRGESVPLAEKDEDHGGVEENFEIDYLLQELLADCSSRST